MNLILKDEDFEKHGFVKTHQRTASASYEKKFPLQSFWINYHYVSEVISLTESIFYDQAHLDRYNAWLKSEDYGKKPMPEKDNSKERRRIDYMKVLEASDLDFILSRNLLYQTVSEGNAFPHWNIDANWFEEIPFEKKESVVNEDKSEEAAKKRKVLDAERYPETV